MADSDGYIAISGNDTFTDLIKAGYTYDVTVKNDYIATPGKLKTEILSFTLYDSDGNNVTEDYYIEYKTGILHLYYSVITLTSDSFTVDYTGKAVSDNSHKYEGVLQDGHTLTLTPVSFVDVGTYANKCTYVVKDSNGNVVTGQYFFQTDYGKITINYGNLTIETASLTKKADGTPLVNGDEPVITEGLAEGHKVEVVFTGSQTSWGYSDNSIDETKIVVRDANGKDVTKNYKISVTFGTLTVTRK